MPVFVRIGEFSNKLCPITSFVRLQPLDSCNMVITNAFEVGITPTIETIFRFLDGKLSAILDRSRIEACQLIDQIVKSGSQIVDDLAYNDADDIWNSRGFKFKHSEDIASFIMRLWIGMYNNTIAYRLTKDIDPTIQIKQVFICPINPLISAIQRVHDMLYYNNGEENEKEAKDSKR